MFPHKRTRRVVAAAGLTFMLSGCSGSPEPPSDSPPPAVDTAVPSRQQMIKDSGPLTVRVEVTTCGDYRSGTGFVVGPNLVATAQSVVAGAQTVTVRGVGVASAVTIGRDADREVTLLQTTTPISDDQALIFAPQPPAVGDEVVAITYPYGRAQTPITGTVNGLDRSLDVGDSRVSGLIQYESGSSAASSGGPLLNRRGEVVGLTLEPYEGDGAGYAVSAQTASAVIEAWKAAPKPVKPSSCKARPRSVVKVDSEHPDAPGLAYFIRRNFDGLNTGDREAALGFTGYETSFDVLSGPLKEELGPLEDFREKRLGVRNRDVVVANVKKVNDLEDTADISFDRISSKQRCTHYAYRYTARLASGTWTLDSRIPLKKNATSC